MGQVAISNLESAVRHGNKALGVYGADLARSKDPDSNTVNVTTTTNSSGMLTTKFERAEDMLQLNALLVGISGVGATATISNYQDRIVSKAGDPNAANFFSAQLANVISGLNIDPSVAGANKEAIGKVEAFCGSMQNYAKGLATTELELEGDLSSTFHDIGNILAHLADNNAAIRGNPGSKDALADERNKLLKQLSSLISFEATASNDGSMSLRTNSFTQADGTPNAQSAAVVLLQDNIYTKFSYSPSMPSMVQIQKVNNAGGKVDSVTSQSLLGASMGGKLEGLLDVGNVIATALTKVNQVASQLKDQINIMHSKGSGWPPSSSFTSLFPVSGTDTAIYSGRAFFERTDGTGNPLTLALKPICLDLDTMAGFGPKTVNAVLQELQQEALCDTQASIGLCPNVYNLTAEPTPNNFLVDQVTLAPSTNIDNNGSFAFQLRLSSGADMDATVEVLEYIVDDRTNGNNGTVTNQLTAPIYLNAGDTMKTPQSITVNLFNNGAGAQARIYLKLRATAAGDKSNGANQTVWAMFPLGVAGGPALAGNSTTFNTRIQGAAEAPDEAGEFAPATFSPAKIGSGQIYAAINTDGKLALNAGQGNGLVIIDQNVQISPIGASNTYIPKGFSDHFGLNPLLIADDDAPAATLSVNPTIIANPASLAVAIPTLSATTNTSVVNGVLQAKASFTIAADPAGGDSVTINGETFTFRDAGPGLGPKEVSIDAGAINNTMENLLTAIQADISPALTNLMTFSVAGNVLTVTAKHTGTKANAITVASSNVANAWNTVPAPGGGGAVHTTALAGGTNEAQASTLNTQVYNYQVGPKTSGAFKDLDKQIQFNDNGTLVKKTLGAYFRDFVAEIATNAAASKSDEKVAEKVADKLLEAYKATTKTERNALLREAVEIANMSKLLHYMINTIIKSLMGILDAVRGG